MGDQNSKCQACKLDAIFLEIHSEPQIRASKIKDSF
jgi:hypothetical protein